MRAFRRYRPRTSRLLPTCSWPRCSNGAVRYTAKPLMCAMDSAADVSHVHQIAMTVVGSEATLRDRPSLVVGLSPISPLYFNENICEATMCGAAWASQFRSPGADGWGHSTGDLCGRAGTAAGRAFGGLDRVADAQSRPPGRVLPVADGVDMRTGRGSMGTCEFGMVSACAVQLGHLHGLPVDVFGLAADAIHMDEQAGYERALNGVLPCLAGADMLSGAGLIEAATGARLEQIVIDDEVFGTILRLRRGFEVNDDTLALDLIDQVGPKGNYLGERMAGHIRVASRTGRCANQRLDSERALADGSGDITQVAWERACTLLRTHEVPPLPDEITLSWIASWPTCDSTNPKIGRGRAWDKRGWPNSHPCLCRPRHGRCSENSGCRFALPIVFWDGQDGCLLLYFCVTPFRAGCSISVVR